MCAYLGQFAGLCSSVSELLGEAAGFLPVLVVGIVAALIPLSLVGEDKGDDL